MEKYIDQIIEMLITYGPKLLGAIVVLIIGFWIIKMITKGISRLMQKKEIAPSLQPFFIGMLSMLLKALLIISVMGMIGIQMTSFIAILGAAGLAFGMSLSGTLQNFAGGVIILIFKPFTIGDLIEAQGYLGTVKEIQIFNTILNSLDNKVIIIPNGSLANSSMINYSAEDTRRVDWSFGIAYGDNVAKARKVIADLINEDTRILKTPEPFIKLGELGDSSVNITVRVWVITPDYWDVYFNMNEQVYITFAKEGLSIPFPQMDVHLHKEGEN